MKPVYITHALRTPVGNLMGSLSSKSSVELGVAVVKSLLKSSNLDASLVSELIMGEVLYGGLGQNPARQTLIHSGIPNEVPAFSVNKVCGSGLKAIALGYESIMLDNSEIIIAGGQESMSSAMHAAYIRSTKKAGNLEMIDMMMHDGLTDAFGHYAMGITAENVAQKFHISRNDQDIFAIESNKKAAAATSKGYFNNEIVPIIVKNKNAEILICKDEFIKPESSSVVLGKLQPAFIENGTVTAGNSSGINDGAAAVILASEGAVTRYNLQPIARILSYARIGVDPAIMGTGPIEATKIALKKAGLKLEDVDLFEINEAFAAQSLCVIRELGIDDSKVNVNGGAIAIGHPIGASGARITVTLMHEMIRRKAKIGLATLCIGGGMGIAMVFELVY
jgi:acetyl-CoA C-acetyltransferase